MPQKKFLEQIADYYTGKPGNGDLADITFIFPNKRSAMFLKRYIQLRVKDRFTLMPRFSTFSRFTSQIVRVGEASRYESLFILYQAYCQALMEVNPDGEEQIRDFDRFIFWGDMILNDFDEIDKALADPKQLYKNLESLKEISSDYLTDEQKSIIKRIWGDTNYTVHVESFWLHTNRGDNSELTRKFTTLWQILGRIYEIFQEKLKENHLTTSGKQMRRALEILKSRDNSNLLNRRYVFVGLSDLSNAEIAIMDFLKNAGIAEFFWDLESPLFKSGDDKFDNENRAIRIISRLRELYPMPQDFEPEPIDSIGNINIIGVPSAMAQSKYAGKVIKEMGKLNDSEAFNTAIVVPDTSQLMHLMLSLPDDLPGINVTMGLPYSSTNFANLFRAIISMQRRMRKTRNNKHTFFYQDVLEVLVHPHFQLVAPQRANSVRQYIFDQRQFNIDAEALTNEFPELSAIFSPVGDTDNIDNTYRYITNLLKCLRESFVRYTTNKVEDEVFELNILDYFEQQLDELHRLMEKYKIDMRGATFFSIFERILQSKTINVEGTPLHGLQIMGVLETRALDFDNIIFLDMNERTFPRRDYVKTMIPNNLRRGYGLPPIEQSESFYSYYFLRAIGRASNVTLLYDSRPPKTGTSEMSRYVTQLMYLNQGDNIKHNQVEFSGKQPQCSEITVNKTPAVMRQLYEFRRAGGKNISASSLKTYLNCPLQFYLQYIVGLRDSEDPTEYMDEAEIGTIFHNTVERLYRPYKEVEITEQIIDKILNDGKLDKILIEEIAIINKLDPETASMDSFNIEARMLKGKIALLIRQMLECEKTDYCNRHGNFTYMDGEMEVAKPWKIYDGLTVNFKMLIDRIDRLDGETLRFIDYKTGKDIYKIGNNLESIFSPDYTKHAIFQLLVYAESYHDLVDPDVDIRIALHIVKKILTENTIAPITLGRGVLPDFKTITQQFRPLLNELFRKIFDDTTPFTQCANAEQCRRCSFNSMCGRSLPPEYDNL